MRTGRFSRGIRRRLASRPSPLPERALLCACLAFLAPAAACDRGSPGIEPSPTTLAAVATVRLVNFDLPLHVAKERASPPERPLVVFATGDAGWKSVDQEIVATIVRLGYPVAAFSAKDYLDHLDNLPAAATPEHVGLDYSKLIAEARLAMSIPDTTSVVLSGFSRGAALSVIAAGDPPLQQSLRGVMVMGLGEVEEHVQRSGRPPTAVDLEVLKPYEYLKALGSLPVSVIQSTRDRFLNAVDARRLFGADTERRQLHAIEAQGHTFSGARDRLFREVGQSLAWIETARHASS